MADLQTFDRWFRRAVILLGVITVLHLTGFLPDPEPEVQLPPSSTQTSAPAAVPTNRWLLAGTVGEICDTLTPQMQDAGCQVLRQIPAAPYWRKLVSMPQATVLATDEFAVELASTTTNPDGSFWMIVPLRPLYRVTVQAGNRRVAAAVSLAASGPLELIMP